MPAITFRAKPESVYHVEGGLAYQRIKVPALTRSHCDMAEFRKHPRFGAYANSDLFPGLLRRQTQEAGIREYIRLDQLPECVSVDTSGFLARVTITIGE